MTAQFGLQPRSEPSPKDTRNSCALVAPQHVRVSPKAAEGVDLAS